MLHSAVLEKAKSHRNHLEDLLQADRVATGHAGYSANQQEWCASLIAPSSVVSKHTMPNADTHSFSELYKISTKKSMGAFKEG